MRTFSSRADKFKFFHCAYSSSIGPPTNRSGAHAFACASSSAHISSACKSSLLEKGFFYSTRWALWLSLDR